MDRNRFLKVCHFFTNPLSGNIGTQCLISLLLVTITCDIEGKKPPLILVVYPKQVERGLKSTEGARTSNEVGAVPHIYVASNVV